MGFLSVYSGVKRVVVDPERDYWVDLKKHISNGDREAAERSLVAMSVVDGKTSVNPDITQYRQLLLTASIAAWNLDEEDGTTWAVTFNNVRRLPGEVFDRLWTEVDGMSKEDPKSRQQFRDGDGGGHSDGDSGTSVPQ